MLYEHEDFSFFLFVCNVSTSFPAIKSNTHSDLRNCKMWKKVCFRVNAVLAIGSAIAASYKDDGGHNSIGYRPN